MAASTPPLAVPSSFVTTRPVSCSASSNARTWARAFWPVLPSITSSTSCGAEASALATTRLIFFSSSIRCSCVGRRPAVSTSTTSLPRALPADTASKLTAAGSPPSWLTISTVLRVAHTPSCSRAAARKVSAAASSTLWPWSARCRVSLPMEVVLPAPLTPATMMTVGACAPITRGFSSGRSRSASASASSALTAAGSVALASLTRRLRSASRCCVARTPVSAISSASSSSSYSASSILVPVKTVAMLPPVLRRPVRRRSIQPWRAPAASGLGAGSGVPGGRSGAGVAAAAGAGAAVVGASAGGGGVGTAGFFLKKLNIGEFLESCIL